MRKLILIILIMLLSCTSAFADTATYYFNSYDSGVEEWETTPANMVDGDTGTIAETTIESDVQLCDGNTNAGTDLGSISKVEIRVYGDNNYAGNVVYLRPIFIAGDGDNHDSGLFTTAMWAGYKDITSDTNAPETWAWSDVQALELDVEFTTKQSDDVEVAKAEIRVTYSSGNPVSDHTYIQGDVAIQ